MAWRMLPCKGRKGGSKQAALAAENSGINVPPGAGFPIGALEMFQRHD